MKAEFEPSTFNLWRDITMVPSYSTLYGHIQEKSSYIYSWSTESDIQILVNLALQDILRLAGLSKYLSVFSELRMFSLRPDLWVVRTSNGMPIGVIEVKKPGKVAGGTPVLDDPILAGQIFDYMMCLRQFNGLRNIFGIITTYNEWKICWLEDTDKAAASEMKLSNDEYGPPMEGIRIASKRVVRCSRIYKNHEPELIKVLVSVVHKMFHSPSTPPKLLYEETRAYVKLTENSYGWETLPSGTILKYTPPPAQTTQFYLLQDYHGGADGRVWLGCSESGHLVVIKFGKTHELQSEQVHMHGADEDTDYGLIYRREAERWNNIWSPNGYTVRVRNLTGRTALVMPFAFHVHMSKEGTIEFKGPNHWAKGCICDNRYAGTSESSEHKQIDEVEGDNVLREQVSLKAKDPMQVAKEGNQRDAKRKLFTLGSGMAACGTPPSVAQ